MKKRYYCIRQCDTTDCGAACLATIAKQNGYNISIAKIREVAGTDKQGTNAFGLIRASEKIGFKARGVKGTKESLYSNIPLPCIAHVILDGSILHYVVIQEIKKDKMVISDPANGIIKISLASFCGENSIQGEEPRYRWTGVLIFVETAEKISYDKEERGVLKRFADLILPQKQILFRIFIASLFYTILSIIGAFYYKELVDNILPNSLEKTLMTFSIGFIILNIFKTILNAFRTQLLIYLNQKIDIKLLFSYYNHVIGLPMNFFSSRKIGEIISRFIDASKVRDAIASAIITIMIDTLMAVIGGCILFIQEKTLFLVAIIMVVIYVTIVVSFRKKYEKLNKKQMEDNSQLTSYMVESFTGIKTIKANSAEQRINIDSEKKFVKLLKDIFYLGFTSNIQATLKTLVELIGLTVIFWIGGIKVIKGHMTIGVLITFNSLLVYFLDPIKNLINLQPQMQTAIVAADRITEIMDLELERTESEFRKVIPKTFFGDITVSNVNFRYGSRQLVLNDLNLEIKKGTRVALVGESGSGKTTLANLLIRLYSPETGSILINGNNIEDIQLNVLREKIAYITQETFLFSDSIYNNLTFGMSNIDPEEVISAAKASRAHEFINDFPLRYETRLEENGFNLSGGQRQRLAIARALIRKPDILILDEATSNLDSITERLIEETILNLPRKMTIIIITHRLSTAKYCDRIYVMNEGKLVENGTHEQLIKNNGYYASMVEKQNLNVV